MKSLVLKGIIAVAEWMVAAIRNGKPLPTVIGSVLGGSGGACAGFLMIAWIVPGILLGALIGASLAAALLPKPPVPKSLDPALRTGSLGAVRRSWSAEVFGHKRFAVLLDRAIYIGLGDPRTLYEVEKKLACGGDPGLEVGRLIPLDQLVELELVPMFPTAFDVVYRHNSKLEKSGVFLPSMEERDRLLNELADLLGVRFDRSERADSFLLVTWGPLLVFALVAALTVGGMMLANHWIENPPPPLVKTGKQDELVRLLTWAEPRGVLLVASVPLLIVVAWLVLRVLRPTRTSILTPVHADGSVARPEGA